MSELEDKLNQVISFSGPARGQNPCGAVQAGGLLPRVRRLHDPARGGLGAAVGRGQGVRAGKVLHPRQLLTDLAAGKGDSLSRVQFNFSTYTRYRL